jgi:flagellar basal body-associated protein FliL
VVSVVSGLATPIVIAQLTGPAKPEFAAGEKEPSPNELAIPEATDKIAFLDFDTITVNLNENNNSRFIKVTFAIQVADSQKLDIEKLLTERKVILINWLNGHLSDKRHAEVKGKMGQSRLRREIHDEFNAVLFDDGVERIQDILFKEFNVQ